MKAIKILELLQNKKFPFQFNLKDYYVALLFRITNISFSAGTLLIILVMMLGIGCSSTYNLTGEATGIIANFKNIHNAKKVQLLKETQYTTPAFIFDSGNIGKTVMIIGGTHGNEPAGYEAALRILKLVESNSPKNGKLIIIPLANRRSVYNYNRRIPVPKGINIERGNLNRCYPGKKMGFPMERMAFEIGEIAIKNNVDVFIDLHEARYFHLNTNKESNRDQGLGQTIIYYPNEISSWIVMNLLDGINETINNPNEKFSAVERPIMHSAAWWAGKKLNVASFTFETMRKMKLKKRIDYHINLVEIILKMEKIW
jgi:hypothetical protein